MLSILNMMLVWRDSFRPCVDLAVVFPGRFMGPDKMIYIELKVNVYE